jgi:CRP-like cAMP-binding protein
MLLAGGSERQLKLLVSGWAAETRVLADSRRQICALHLPGDVITPRMAGPTTLYGVTALTKLECLDLAMALETPESREKAATRAALLRALNLNEERRYEHIVRLGQHTAPERMIHLLFELRDRLTLPGSAAPDNFRLPLTQEDLADALGLSVVHINRTLRRLRAQKLLDIRFGGVTLMQPNMLHDIIQATKTA